MTKFFIEEKAPFQFPAGLRILVVDNDPTILEIIKQICFQCHYHERFDLDDCFYLAVITFYDVPLALNYLWEKKGCIDVILIEVHMQNMDGYEFLQHVSKNTNVPVISM
ncbi:Two-component response regulator ORR24, partial [Mucuna pruriens]